MAEVTARDVLTGLANYNKLQPKSCGSTEEVPVEAAVGSAPSRLPAFDANPSILLAREDEEAEVPRVLVTGRCSRSTIGPDNRRADRRTDMFEEGGENLRGEGVWKVARRSAGAKGVVTVLVAGVLSIIFRTPVI